MEVKGLSIYGKVNIIKTLLLPKMIYASLVICTPSDVIKEFNNLVFNFFVERERQSYPIFDVCIL